MSNVKPLKLTVFNYCVSLLAQSSRDLAARFGQQRTVDGQIALIREELAEVLAATDDAHRVEELCDLIVVWQGFYDANCVAKQLRMLEAIYPMMPISDRERSYSFENLINRQIDNAKKHGGLSTTKAMEIIIYHIKAIPNAAELFPVAVDAVVAKNAAKSDATHYLDAVTGKITKRKVCPRCGICYPPSDFVDMLCPSCVNEAKQS